MRSRALVRTRWVGACACAALVLAGCGAATSGTSAITVSGKTLIVYESQPPGPPDPTTTDILDAEALALPKGGLKVGRYTVEPVVVHNGELSANARASLQDHQQDAIAYLGELQPGTSQVSVQILNQQGLLEVSPADTAVYLTQLIPPVSTSLDTFYPGHSTYQETFARVVPNSGQEAKALVGEMQAEHVSKLFVTDDGSLYGRAIAIEVSSDAKAAGLTPVTSPSAADGVFYGASLTSAAASAGATHALDGFAASNAAAKLFAPSGLYDDSFVAGLSPAAQQALFVSSPGFLPRNLPTAGRTFVSDFKRAYGHEPVPQAVFGYEAMSAVLAVLADAKTSADNRALVVTDFRELKRQNSAIGTYSISHGDPSIAPIIFSRVRGGQLRPFKFVQLSG